MIAAAPRTVLLADDDPFLRALVARALRDEGYRVVEASDGAQLAAHIEDARHGERTPPDLVVTDVQMPGLSGLEVIALARACGWCVPVVVITGSRERAVHAVARRFGAAAVFAKPFDLRALCTAVQALLASASSPSSSGGA